MFYMFYVIFFLHLTLTRSFTSIARTQQILAFLFVSAQRINKRATFRRFYGFIAETLVKSWVIFNTWKVGASQKFWLN